MAAYQGQFENGTITIQVTDGTAPFTYTVYEDGTSTIAQNSNGINAQSIQNTTSYTFNSMPPGPYGIKVLDSQGCEVTGNVTIDSWPCTNFELTASVIKHETVFGLEDGVISYVVTEGENWDGTTTTSNYIVTLSLNGSSIDTSTSLTGSFTNLAPGNYIISVTETGSGSNCVDTQALTINAADEALDRTFYWFHGGAVNYLNDANSIVGSGFWTDPGSQFAIDGDSVNLVDFDTAITTLMQRYDDGISLPYPVGSGDMPEGQTIAGNNGQFGLDWGSTPTQQYYYFIVPNNSDFPEDLTQLSILYTDGNPYTSAAAARRGFTYNGNDYWLYRPNYQNSAAALTLRFE